MDREMQQTARAADKFREIHGNDVREDKTAFEEINDRIMGCSERVLKTAHSIETIGTRIMGSLPEKADEGKGDPAMRVEPDGTLDRVYQSLNRLDGSLSRLEAVSLRLERV